MTDTSKTVREFVVKEMNRINVTATYLVTLSDNPLERHNELRSMETFRKKFTFPVPGDMAWWYKVQTYHEWRKNERKPYLDALYQLPLEFVEPNREPRINADLTVDLWTFYNLIRFDYKKQVYVD